MITCKTCHKFAKLKMTFISGMDEVKIAGSCKRCGYEDRTDYPKGTTFQDIAVGRIDYEDFDELGILDR
jgi:RNase P subunit RPR2